MKKLALPAVAAAALLLSPAVSFSKKRVFVGSFLPPNAMRIEVGSAQAHGITQGQFDAVMDRVQALYGPIIAAKGGQLVVNRLWDDPTVNASAERQGTQYIINMYGGLARHEVMTQDGMALVACHELGHHLGGAPKIGAEWATNEGGADYYANLKCLRRVFADAGSREFTHLDAESDIAAQACAKSFPNSASDQALCVRGTVAGLSVSELLRQLGGEANPVKLETPDTSVVGQTNDEHPAAQCRLDTYFQGSLCPRAVSEEQADGDVNAGACTRAAGFSTGLRPLCWYKPPQSEPSAPMAAAFSSSEAKPAESATLRGLRGSSLWNGL